MSDETLNKLVENMKSLEKIIIGGYLRLITDTGIESMMRSAKNLKYVLIKNAPQVSKKLGDKLKLEYPSVKVLL